jgi:hypothetical protein
VCSFGLITGTPLDSASRNSWCPSEADAERQLTDCLEYFSGTRVSLRATQRSPGSYGLKHEVETWLRLKDRPEPNYIGNGVLIVSLMLLKVPLWHEAGNPNVLAALGVNRPLLLARKAQQQAQRHSAMR